MADLAHLFGNDLSLSPTGDLALSDSTQAGQERVLRRLLTNPGGYIWQLDYGAGLPAMVGTPADSNRIQAVVGAQMTLEPAVSRLPVPVVTVTASINGTVVASAKYTDAATGNTQVLTVPVT